MITRIATKADIKTIKNIWDNARGKSPFTEWFFNKVFYSGNTVIASEENIPIAAACTIPYTMKVNGHNINAGYICTIEANPENRTKDIMNALTADTLSFFAENNMPIAFAIPENYKFYEKHGFSLCYEYKQYDISPSDLPDYGIKGNILRPQEASEQVISLLDKVYNKFTLARNGYVVRNTENWKLIFDDLYNNYGGNCVIYRSADEDVSGYMFYIVRDNKMWIYELCYSSHQGLEGLLGFIKSHSERVEKISLKAPADDLLYLSFCDNRLATKLCPFALARITDAKALLRLFARNISSDIRLQIIDRVMENNNRTFAFTEDDVITVDADPDVTTDIGTLTQLALGYLSVAEAAELNLIKGDATLLNNIFKKEKTYVNMLCM